MTNASESLRRIYATVSRIPKGRVATYGQVAQVAGLPRRARLVGRALRELNEDSDVPWRRVVNAKGTISLRGNILDHEGLQEQLLRREGVDFDGRAIPLERYGWQAARGAKAAGTAKGGARSRPAANGIAVKRVYNPPSKSDGTRVLVNRLWPRGIAKAKARVDAWLRRSSQHGAAHLVRPRPRALGQVPAPLSPRARELRRGAAGRRSRAARSDHTALRREGRQHNNAVALRGYLARKKRK